VLRTLPRLRSIVAATVTCSLRLGVVLAPGCVPGSGPDPWSMSTHGSGSGSRGDDDLGSTTDASSTTQTHDEPEDDTSGSSGGAKFDAGVPDAPADPACPCAAGTDRVVVLSNLGELWTYDPATLAFDRLGALECPVFSTTSFSLAVDHRARALVQFRATGDIFRIDLDTLDCEDPGYEPPATEPVRFGLGFVSLHDDDACEGLFGWSYDGSGWSEGPGVGRLVRFVGPTLERDRVSVLDYNGGEFTGTGDGRAFAFAGVSPAKIVELDVRDGSIDRVSALPGVELTEAFAMAFWGGALHLFTESATDPGTSRVAHIDVDALGTDAASLHVDVVSAPVLVVGAATSTCAPLVPAG
jgi:hypothetical protein